MPPLAADRSLATAHQHSGVIARVHALEAQLLAAIREAHLDEARAIVRHEQLPPIAWGYLASLLQQHRIPAEIIERVLT